MFAVINSKTKEFIVELGSRIIEEQRPHVRLWVERKHAEAFIKCDLLNMSGFEVVPVICQIQ